MTQLFIIITVFLMTANSYAGNRCDLSFSVGVQLPSGQILGVKDLVAGFNLVVVEQSCWQSSSGDDCNSFFDPLSQISEEIKNQLAVRLKAQISELKFIKKPNMREPASAVTQSQSDLGQIRASGKCI